MKKLLFSLILFLVPCLSFSQTTVTLSQGYNWAATVVMTVPGQGSLITTIPQTMNWFDLFYGSPQFDPGVESVVVTAVTGDSLSLTRSNPKNHNSPGHTYALQSVNLFTQTNTPTATSTLSPTWTLTPIFTYTHSWTPTITNTLTATSSPTPVHVTSADTPVPQIPPLTQVPYPTVDQTDVIPVTIPGGVSIIGGSVELVLPTSTNTPTSTVTGSPTFTPTVTSLVGANVNNWTFNSSPTPQYPVSVTNWLFNSSPTPQYPVSQVNMNPTPMGGPIGQYYAASPTPGINTNSIITGQTVPLVFVQATGTNTNTPTITNTPTNTYTFTYTPTNTFTGSATPTNTPTITNTPTPLTGITAQENGAGFQTITGAPQTMLVYPLPQGISSIEIQVTGFGAAPSTLTFWKTMDDTNWIQTSVYNDTTGAVSFATAAGIYCKAAGSIQGFRIISSGTWSSGAATIAFISSTGVHCVEISEPLPSGSNTMGAVWIVPSPTVTSTVTITPVNTPVGTSPTFTSTPSYTYTPTPTPLEYSFSQGVSTSTPVTWVSAVAGMYNNIRGFTVDNNNTTTSGYALITDGTVTLWGPQMLFYGSGVNVPYTIYAKALNRPLVFINSAPVTGFDFSAQYSTDALGVK